MDTKLFVWEAEFVDALTMYTEKLEALTYALQEICSQPEQVTTNDLLPEDNDEAGIAGQSGCR